MIYNSLYILKQSLIAMSLENGMHYISFGIYEYCNATAPGRYYQELYQLVEHWYTVYPKKYAHGFFFAVLCCGYTLTDFPKSIRLTSLALWQSNDCPSASKATLMNMDKYFMWIHYERLHNHNKAKHNKTVCIFLGIYCTVMNVIESVAATKIYVFKYSSAVYVMLLHFTPVDVNFFRKRSNRYCKTVMKPSYLYNGNPFTSKTTS